MDTAWGRGLEQLETGREFRTASEFSGWRRTNLLPVLQCFLLDNQKKVARLLFADSDEHAQCFADTGGRAQYVLWGDAAVIDRF
ncbi:hypothetical protein chiPu_0017418 [Chiloscyllium punctatum]|uniref:Uncharacterized protein n=1 Tax=Chiloscyllium punctatum TaxID=137246 RepID=A0A401RFT0_CHIPU|nr:hypothetical protein [Chiloscyllium punctatum]